MKSVGIDIGGTFTDTVLVSDGAVYTEKVPTSDDLRSGVVEGFLHTCDASGVSPSDIDMFSHSSTISVNALIEGEGAKTAIVTTSGFRDVLEIGETHKDAKLLYNYCGEHEPPLVPRRYRYEVTERINANGDIVTPIDSASIDDLIDQLVAHEIESVAICLLHAYRNPVHEHHLADAVSSRIPDIEISQSSLISPIIREYSRTCTTAVNAYIKPRVRSYLEELRADLESEGLTVPITMMKSNGGIARSETIVDRPVIQMLSGPVGGVKSAQFTGNQIDRQNIITLDMGGTSADIAIIEQDEFVEVSHYDVRGMKVNGPFINIKTVGAGGGSIAWLDRVNALRVGPHSAGSDPGPVCYGRGGTQPTVTDADLVLGLLNPDAFAGGQFSLDVDAAHESIDDAIARPLDMTIPEAAVAIRDITVEHLASSIQVSTVKEGYDPREFTLIAYGGAGPMHACEVAREMGITEVVFPAYAGLFSSVGLITSDIRHEYIQSVVERVESIDYDNINHQIDEMITRGSTELAADGVPESDQSFIVSFDMMYANQAHHMNADMRGTQLASDTLEDLIENFERAHENRYGFTHQSESIELVNVRVTAGAPVELPELTTGTDIEPAESGLTGTRSVRLDRDTRISVPYLDWERLPIETQIETPAIIEGENSTAWIPPGFTATTDRDNHVIATMGVHE